MARIAFAWELGGEFGHAMACNAIARILRPRGHHIAFIFRELHRLTQIPDCAAHEIFQAPVSVSEGEGEPLPMSFAEIMVGCGYDRPEHLTGMLGAWFALLRRWKPDLLVADFSPTALLAARVMGLRRVTYTNGFSCPPRLSPLPAFRFDKPVSPERLRASDSRALASVNGALARFGMAPLQTLAQQFETDEDFLATFPELDSYEKRPTSGYWGPRVSFDAGVDVRWPGGTGKRILVYVKKDLPQVNSLIGALAASPHQVIAFIPELDEARAALLRSPSRIVSHRAIRLQPLLKDCDLLVSQGGNICPGTLMYGVPQLVFPSQYEQFLTSHRIVQVGAGIFLSMEADPEAVARALEKVLGDPSFGAAAMAYRARYPAYSPTEQQRRVVVRIEELLATPPRPSALPQAGAILSPTTTRQGAPK